MKFQTLAPLLFTSFLSTQCTDASSSKLQEAESDSSPFYEYLTTADLGATRITEGQGKNTKLLSSLNLMMVAADKSKDSRFACKGSESNRLCDLIDPTLPRESISCEISASEVNPAVTNGSCKITAQNWPQLSPGISQIVATEMIKLGFADGSSFIISSNRGSLSCSQEGTIWSCSFAGVSDVKYSWKTPNLQTVTLPAGLKDEFGNPLPRSSSDYEVKLPSGAIKPASYRAPASLLSQFKSSLPEDERETEDHDDVEGCSQEEILAIFYYTGEGYKEVNKGLRRLAQGQEIDPATDLNIRAVLSSMNCADQSKPEVVVRGANLSPEKLAKYQKDAIIVEHAFTSTTMGKKVHSDFKGSTEFRIIGASGANLDGLGTSAEEGEKELLIRPGTLFKVLDRHVLDKKVTVITLQQLP